MDSEPVKAEPRNLGATIARNSLWYAIEVVIVLLATLLTSIAMARTIGPTRLGPYNYIYWLSNTAGGLAALGIPAATSKFIAEYLRGDTKGIARAIFFFTLRVQCVVAVGVTALGLILVFTKVDHAYRNSAVFLVASMLPQMIMFIPSQANAGAENISANTRAAFAGAVVCVVAVILSLTLGWELQGIAAGVLLGRCVELAAKLIPVLGWITKLPPTLLPFDLRRRMITFSSHNLILLILNVVVWDRSDIIFLRMLQTDTRQLTFFSVAFSLIERLFLIPQSFAGGVGVSQLAEYGRDRQRLPGMTTTSAKYVFLMGLPLLAGAASLSGPLISAVYGPAYAPMAHVFGLMALFAIPRTIMFPAYNLLLATENQKVLVVWNCLCGALNVLLDVLLIPSHGALGAAAANGIAQALASVGVWVSVCRRFGIALDFVFFRKLSLVCAVMAMVELMIVAVLPRWFAIGVGVPVGVSIFLFGLRITAVLAPEDSERLERLGNHGPTVVRVWFSRLVNFLMPSGEGRPGGS